MSNLNLLPPSTHAQRLERWAGPDVVANLQQTMRDFPRHAPPVAVAGMPGLVYVRGGGDIVGRLEGGYFSNAVDYNAQKFRRVLRAWAALQQRQAAAGFTSLSDLISEATSGWKSQQLLFQKAPTTGTTIGNATVARNVGALPVARGTGGTSGTGVKCTSATTGALKFANPTGGNTTHLTNISLQANAVGSLLLMDVLWDMTYNHASSTSTAVDSANRPDRYQTSVLAPGNFISGEITTALSATAHNLTVTYVDDAGNTAEAATAYAAPVSAVAARTPTVAGQWFVPMNSGDTGARYITNIAQSTITSVTGVTTWFVAHPLALVPVYVANVPFFFDGINSAFSLERIYDDACLSFMTPSIAATGTITYNGLIRLVQG